MTDATEPQLVPCVCCGARISAQAVACPLCGEPADTPAVSMDYGVVGVIQLVGALALLLGILAPVLARVPLGTAVVWFGWCAGTAIGCFALSAIIQTLRQIERNTRRR